MVSSCIYLPKKLSFEGKHASFKNIKFIRGNNQTDTWRHQHSVVFIMKSPLQVHVSFLPNASSKLNWIYFELFEMKWKDDLYLNMWKSLNAKFDKETDKTPLVQLLFIFCNPLVYRKNFHKTTIHAHLGIFLGWALRPDSVSPQMNTIVSSDQFKSITIRENLVVNYNNGW